MLKRSMQNRELKYSEAILEANDQILQKDPLSYLIGLGVPDPKGIFGTTIGLQEKYGSNRVMDMPPLVSKHIEQPFVPKQYS